MSKDIMQTLESEKEYKLLQKMDAMKANIQEVINTIDNSYDFYADTNNMSQAAILDAIADITCAIALHTPIHLKNILDRLIKFGFLISEDCDMLDEIYNSLIKHNLYFDSMK